MAERVVRNVENDYLMCSICLGRYRDPRLLPCGHSFCKSCLEEHIKQTVPDSSALHFKCPNDRTRIGRPSQVLAPKQWASAFPIDTFLCSLIGAVVIHASSKGENAESITCKLHKSRLKEFYCLSCSVTACPYCIVKNHKAANCECVSIDEAMEILRPKIDDLRMTLHQQVQCAWKMHINKSSDKNSFQLSKEQALTELTDFETKMNFHYEAAKKKLQEMKLTINETGTFPIRENAQISVIVGNINETIKNFSEVCNNGSGIDVLNLITKIEAQVKEYNGALKTLSNRSPALEIRFVPNSEMERIFENPPTLGSVVVSNPEEEERKHISAEGVTIDLSSIKTSLKSNRSAKLKSNTARSEPNTARSNVNPRRKKVTFIVKSKDQTIRCWQLTGVAIIGDSVLVTDEHNGKVFKFEIRHPSFMPQELDLGSPVCITNMHSSLDALITLRDLCQLALVDTKELLKLKSTIETTKPYDGIIRISEDRYAVSCCIVGKQCVDIIDTRATILRTITNDDAGHSLFGCPKFLSVTPHGDLLVSDRDKCALMCLDIQGRVKWSYPTQASPWGVSCHELGIVYLCIENNEIHSISETGSLVDSKFMEGRKEGINVPNAIHTTGDYIAVTEWGSNPLAPSSPKVHLFDI